MLVAAEIKRLQKRIKELQAALRPFASVTLPDNWPGNCVLTWQDYAFDTPEQPQISFHDAYANYLHHEAQGGPTIADYRRAMEALEGTK